MCIYLEHKQIILIIFYEKQTSFESSPSHVNRSKEEIIEELKQIWTYRGVFSVFL